MLDKFSQPLGRKAQETTNVLPTDLNNEIPTGQAEAVGI